MTVWNCERFEAHIGDCCSGALDGEDLSQAQFHLDICESCRESLTLWEGLARTVQGAAPEPLPPLVERRFVLTALGGTSPHRPRTRTWGLAVALCGLAGLVAGGVFWGVVSYFDMTSASPQAALARSGTAEVQARSAPETAVQRKASRHRGVTTTADGRRVIEVANGIRLWLGPGTLVHTDRLDRLEARFRLERGKVVAQVDEHPPGYRFVVATPQGEVEAFGTVFSVEVSGKGPAVARVLRGTVRVKGRGKQRGSPVQSFQVEMGHQGRVGDTAPVRAEVAELELDMGLLKGGTPHLEADQALWTVLNDPPPVAVAAPPHRIHAKKRQPPKEREPVPEVAPPPEEPDTDPPPPSLESLFSQAAAKRKTGDYRGAARSYDALIKAYPDSKAALNAAVSLGQLELVELKRPKWALKQFESYLGRAPSGLLAEEARLGKLRACEAMGRTVAIKEAADEYLEAHPNGYAGAEVIRKRAGAKVTLGDCKGAVADYRWLRMRWPGSRQIKHAENGLKACGAIP